MIRLLYSLAWWLALPLVLLRLWWRGNKEPGYRQHLAERLGIYASLEAVTAGQPLLWIHAVSVGETRAAEPLVEALLDAYPGCRILLTHMTPTGRATGRALFARHRERVMQSYSPYDTGWLVRRFLHHYSPRICILMETEVWPNLIAECERARVPVALLNARLSARSLARAERLSALMKPAARRISCVAAQTEADAERLRAFGATNVVITGSVKFDVAPPQEMLDQGRRLRACIGTRPVWLCASTREGEEGLILDALPRLQVPDALLVLVPRHPQRFDAVARLIAERGLVQQRRSALGEGNVAAGTQVLLGDSMGEMFAYYAACDLAFIGGGLLPLGGQNLIEACAVGKPVLVGPHTFNFAAISEDAVAAGAALRVADADELCEQVGRLLGNAEQRRQMGAEALAFAKQHRGATERMVTLLRPLIDRG